MYVILYPFKVNHKVKGLPRANEKFVGRLYMNNLTIAHIVQNELHLNTTSKKFCRKKTIGGREKQKQTEKGQTATREIVNCIHGERERERKRKSLFSIHRLQK